MSRGPGSMQRAILAALADGPDTWWGIYHHVTGSYVVKSENYRHSLRRALRSLIATGQVAEVPDTDRIGWFSAVAKCPEERTKMGDILGTLK